MFGVSSPRSETKMSGTPITGSARLWLRKEKQNDDYYLTKQFSVAKATGWSENDEFSKPVTETDRARPSGRGLACLL
jgi:hypothetical protein